MHLPLAIYTHLPGHLEGQRNERLRDYHGVVAEGSDFKYVGLRQLRC
jgi:hypothetical protein